MTEKRFVPIFDGFDKRVVGAKDNGRIISFMDMFEVLNELSEENEQLKSINQELRNELKFDEKMYKTFKEIIDEADDLISSHLSKHYQRKWKNFCKHRGVLDD